MKYFQAITTALVLPFILGTPVISYAQYYGYPSFTPGGTPYNPIYVEEVQDPLQKQLSDMQRKQQENNAKIDRLKSRYGISKFYDCYNDYAQCLDKDIANPNTHAQCLSQTEYCLERKELLSQFTCQTGQVYYNGTCVGYDAGCKEKYGMRSFYSGLGGDGKLRCDCESGYAWQDGVCVANRVPTCPTDQVLSGNQCITRDQGCVNSYGANAYWNGKFSDDGAKYLCDCRPGYSWNPLGTACVTQASETPDPAAKGVQEVMNKLQSSVDDAQMRINVLERERTLAKPVDRSLSARLNGLILLQVEQGGEGWYVYPDNQRRYYLGRPSDAHNLMRRLGLGATHAFITGYTTFPSRVLGKILIDIEDHGKAYYIYPKDRKAYYLGRPADAFRVMWDLGLGISNADIRKIAVEQ